MNIKCNQLVKHAYATRGHKFDCSSSLAIAGIWHHVFDSNDKIKEIWFLRQLSHDELESKASKQTLVRRTWNHYLCMMACSFTRGAAQPAQMKEKPSQKGYDWSKFKGSSEEPSEERSKKHDKVCRYHSP
jgi:hypothetical protein